MGFSQKACPATCLQQFLTAVSVLQVLYLPSLWHHYVRQRCSPEGVAVMAVNFWYDMAFDCKAAYANFCEELANIPAAVT